MSTDEQFNKDNENSKVIHFMEEVEPALTKAKNENKLLVILCENGPSTNNNTDTINNNSNNEIWNDSSIIQLLTNNAICLRVYSDSISYEHFVAVYPVFILPTIYFINSSNGKALKILWGDQITQHNVLTSIDDCFKSMNQQDNVNSDNNSNNNVVDNNDNIAINNNNNNINNDDLKVEPNNEPFSSSDIATMQALFSLVNDNNNYASNNVNTNFNNNILLGNGNNNNNNPQDTNNNNNNSKSDIKNLTKTQQKLAEIRSRVQQQKKSKRCVC